MERDYPRLQGTRSSVGDSVDVVPFELPTSNFQLSLLQADLEYPVPRPGRPPLDVEVAELTPHLLQRFSGQVHLPAHQAGNAAMSHVHAPYE